MALHKGVTRKFFLPTTGEGPATCWFSRHRERPRGMGVKTDPGAQVLAEGAKGTPCFPGCQETPKQALLSTKNSGGPWGTNSAFSKGGEGGRAGLGNRGNKAHLWLKGLQGWGTSEERLRPTDLDARAGSRLCSRWQPAWTKHGLCVRLGAGA